eukprot:Skav234607  [mRNA]  locus=scaffold1110:102942:103462:- [translate_table: standard]
MITSCTSRTMRAPRQDKTEEMQSSLQEPSCDAKEDLQAQLSVLTEERDIARVAWMARATAWKRGLEKV